MKYIIIDAELGGTGIRDPYQGGYIEPKSLNLNDELLKKIDNWLLKYQNEHYNSFENTSLVEILDKEGKEIALLIKFFFGNIKVDYYSAAKLTKVSI